VLAPGGVSPTATSCRQYLRVRLRASKYSSPPSAGGSKAFAPRTLGAADKRLVQR
jgi:hypothetical protein